MKINRQIRVYETAGAAYDEPKRGDAHVVVAAGGHFILRRTSFDRSWREVLRYLCEDGRWRRIGGPSGARLPEPPE